MNDRETGTAAIYAELKLHRLDLCKLHFLTECKYASLDYEPVKQKVVTCISHSCAHAIVENRFPMEALLIGTEFLR